MATRRPASSADRPDRRPAVVVVRFPIPDEPTLWPVSCQGALFLRSAADPRHPIRRTIGLAGCRWASVSPCPTNGPSWPWRRPRGASDDRHAEAASGAFSRYGTPAPNADVALYTGRLHLRVKAGTLTGRGRSFLSWKPSPHLAFELDCDRPLRRMTDEDNGVLVHMAVASNP